jgi:hypothetical protein
VHGPGPAVLLLFVYAAALAVALTDVGSHALAGTVVLAGLATRWALRHRRAVHPAARPTGEAPATAV